jgi:hypothetical protein
MLIILTAIVGAFCKPREAAAPVPPTEEKAPDERSQPDLGAQELTELFNFNSTELVTDVPLVAIREVLSKHDLLASITVPVSKTNYELALGRAAVIGRWMEVHAVPADAYSVGVTGNPEKSLTQVQVRWRYAGE